MRFDYTHGKTENYIVSTHYELVDDYAYFHDYAEAKRYFDNSSEYQHKKGTRIELYDCVNDARKAYKRF